MGLATQGTAGSADGRHAVAYRPSRRCPTLSSGGWHLYL